MPDTATVCLDAYLEVAELGALRDGPNLTFAVRRMRSSGRASEGKCAHPEVRTIDVCGDDRYAGALLPSLGKSECKDGALVAVGTLSKGLLLIPARERTYRVK